MALAFRALTQQGNASGAGLTVTKPTGTVDGDIIIVVAYLETASNTWSSVGSGFTSIRSDAVSTEFTEQIWWKRASGEPASWTWTPTSSAWRTVSAASYSGNTGTGTAIDVHNATAATGIVSGAQTAPSVTTTAANDMLTLLYSNFSGSNPTALTGAASTLRGASGGQAIGDNIIAAAGATGTTRPSAGIGTEDYAGAHVALFLASSGAGATILLLNQMPNTLVRM